MKFQLENIEESTLEKKVDETTLHASVSQLKTTPSLSLEEFIKKFNARYDQEQGFRESVNLYMGITGFKRVKLEFGKRILPRWYKHKKDELIKEYATRIKQGLDDAEQLKADMTILDAEKESAKKNEYEHKTALEIDRQGSEEYRQTYEARTNALQAVETEHQQRSIELETTCQADIAQIKNETDPTIVIGQKLHEYIKSMPLISVNESGKLSFDEERIVEKLQERFLDEIIDGIEKESGERGFYSTVKKKYSDLIAYWDEIQDLSELPEVEWIQSIIYSRSRGYRLPQYPFLVTGKTEDKTFNRTSLDTAIIIDSSGSMSGNKLELAKKAGLANHALMRRLNPKNNTYLAYYSNDVNPVNSVGFIKGVNAQGWTRTDLALDWLYNSLDGKGLGIAYLITDGAPEGTDDILKRCERAASQFASNPNLMLRIFLVEPNDDVKKIVKKIGKAAGNDTKVIPVTSQDIGKGMIKDITGSIGQMYSINEF